MAKTPIYINVPYPLLRDKSKILIDNLLNPEIYFSATVLDGLKREELISLCKNLAGVGVAITFHAPYMDMSPGSPDPKIRSVVLERLNQVMELAEAVRPKAIVVHGGYDRWRYDGNVDLWLKNSLEVWPIILRKASRMETKLAMENVFDDTPEPITRLLDAMDSPHFGHCFDVGHFRLFSKVSMEEWFRRLGKRIVEVHIHDNNGGRDEHLPPGDGDIDFERFFALLRTHSNDVIHTIEPHREEHILKNLEVLSKYLDPSLSR